METSPKQLENNSNHSPIPSFLPSPNSSSTSSTSSSTSPRPITTNTSHLPSPKPITRSESVNPYPTTFVQADTSSFKQVVQMLTGSSKPANATATATAATAQQQPDPSPKTHNIPPIKSIPKKQQSFKLYERRNSLKNNFKINPLINPNNNSAFSPRKQPEILSPSILDFPALVLSPVTPLIPDPFDRCGSGHFSPSLNVKNSAHLISSSCSSQSSSLMDRDAEEKAIKEKGFYLHPSPASTPRDSEPPRLLPLFPVTSPRVVSGSSTVTATTAANE